MTIDENNWAHCYRFNVGDCNKRFLLMNAGLFLNRNASGIFLRSAYFLNVTFVAGAREYLRETPRIRCKCMSN